MTETVNFKPAETPAEKPAEVAQKEQQQQQVVAGERPAWLPENFKTVEDFTKSYADQRAELTRTQQELAKLKPAGEQKPEEKSAEKKSEDKPAEQTPEQKAAAEAVAKSGLDVSTFQTEFNTTGDVSEASRAKIAEGLKAQFGEQAREVVDSFIEGQKARTSNYQAQVFTAAGGEEQYGQMVAWAKTSFNKAEIENFNAAVTKGDLNAARMAVDGLKARYETANGKQPALLGGGPAAAAQPGFASSYEMQTAIKDPRYAKDPAYRKSVEQRIGKSNF